MVKTVTKVQDLQHQLAQKEAHLAELNAQIAELEAKVSRDWEDAKAFARVSGELDRFTAGRQQLTEEIEQLRAEVTEAEEQERLVGIAELRGRLAEVRQQAEAEATAWQLATQKFIDRHYDEFLAAERELVNELSRLGVGEQAQIKGDERHRDHPLFSWGMVEVVQGVRKARDSGLLTAEQMAVMATGLSRDTRHPIVGMPRSGAW